MITVPVLTKQDLEIFKGKQVVLYSHRVSGVWTYKCLKYYGVEVLCCCIEKKLSWMRRVNIRIRGLVDITPEQLPAYIKKYDNIIIQSIEFDSAQIQHVREVAKQLDVAVSPITSGEILNAFLPFVKWTQLKSPLYFLWGNFCRQKNFAVIKDPHWCCFQRKKMKELVEICSPPKTADHSFMYTFDILNNREQKQCESGKIQYINVWHSPRALKRVIRKKNIKKNKVILGVRDPISQNLSLLYQRLSSGLFFTELPFNSMALCPNLNRICMIEQYEKQFETDASNVQIWWNSYIEPYIKTNKRLGAEKGHTGYIQAFIPMFQNEVLDILFYPFDKKRGYAIVKEGNIEVFVYQLEKLNSLVPELSDWIGVPFDKLENGNQASDKWIAESYKQAQEEIEITQEYFDKCFNEPYVKHCYSEADIEKFKARWRPHIKKEA